MRSRSPIAFEQLGWRLDQLLEIVDAMTAARNSCTDNDPAGARGWMAWKEGTRRTREIGLPMGLAREDIDGIPWTTDIARKLRFCVANTDDATGVDMPALFPQNRSRKGPGTERAISANLSIGSLLAELPLLNVVPISRMRPQPGIFVSWFLCHYSEGDAVRSELSCPVSVEGGFFTDFVERIFLQRPDPDDPARRREGDAGGGEDFDIPVSRK